MNARDKRLASERAEVERARERLAGRLDRVDEEVRGHVASAAQTIAWKAGAAAAAFVAALTTRKVLNLLWTRLRGSEPPEDPTDPATGWGDAVGWTVATTVGVGVAQLVARRGAAAGWAKATGDSPPGFDR
ncbi:DUF4235 domain-containing protein [Egibacter rhizosphaerae]|uniref:DUF4235 domain-containing protein n=1 Tax=Egibacter rhizosphaerae TaxID=1670831 RepID=UPI0013F168C6|nr:DUF4235 domain-containing protein [Egibacter rhizosphaerae]